MSWGQYACLAHRGTPIIMASTEGGCQHETHTSMLLRINPLLTQSPPVALPQRPYRGDEHAFKRLRNAQSESKSTPSCQIERTRIRNRTRWNKTRIEKKKRQQHREKESQQLKIIGRHPALPAIIERGHPPIRAVAVLDPHNLRNGTHKHIRDVNR